MMMMMMMMMMMIMNHEDDDGDDDGYMHKHTHTHKRAPRERGITDWHATRQAEEDGKEGSKLKGGEIG